MYDKNGNKIYEEDFHHLYDDSVIYITPKGVEFSYENLLSMYEKEKKLGEGGYGSVYLFKNILNNELSAVKIVHLPHGQNNAQQIQKVLREASYLLTLDHESIINIDTVFFHTPSRVTSTNKLSRDMKNSKIYMFTEYMPGGELKRYLAHKKTPCDESEAKKIAFRLIAAIAYIHKNRVIHCDLKLENILLKDKSNP